MPKKLTIYDVAKKANVAISTVSRVLNDSPYVSDETKSKVDLAIKELDFRPQFNARKLARSEPQIIAVAVPTFTTPFFNEVLKGVKDELMDIDLDFIIYNTGSADPEENFKNFLDRGVPDALLIFSIDITDEIHNRLKGMQVPVVLVGSNHPEYNYIYWDNYQGGTLAAKHLIDKGYRDFGIIRSHSKSQITDDREKGFRDTLSEAGISLAEDRIVTGITKKHAGFSEEAGYEAVKILKDRDQIPEVIFCTNDAQAIGAMHAIDELGLSIPEDIGIMGYDNIKVARYLGLTTVDQQMYDVGIKAIKSLRALIKDMEQPSKHVVIPPTIVERKSTQKPKS